MKLNEDYEIKLVIIENNNVVPGDVYDSFETFKQEHPHSLYTFGFCVVSTKDGYIPDGCHDWNDSPEEALMDYFENVRGKGGEDREL